MRYYALMARAANRSLFTITTMSLLDIAASPILSAALGGVSALATGVLGFFQKREDNKFALLKMDKERELTQMMANIEDTKQAGILAAIREKGASEAFTASVESEGRIKGEATWVSNLRGSTRPGLTWLYQVAFFVFFGIALVALWKQWAEANDILPIIQYMVIAMINSATMTLSWWFGQRQMDKLTTTWGNKVSGASIGAAVKP